MGRPGRASVLYVTYDGLLEPLGASQVVPYVRGLTGSGISMEILSFEKPADLADDLRRERLKRDLDGVGVAWTALRYHKSPSLPATAWDVLAGRRRVAAWAAARSRARLPGVIHARGYLPGLMGLAGRARGAKLLFDMRGFWVDERIEGGYWAPDGLPVRLGRRAERRLLRDADHLVLLTHRGVDRLRSLAGSGAAASVAPATVVPTCVDLERFQVAGDRGAARSALGLGPGPVLIHTGTLTGWYDGAATMAVARAFVEDTGATFVVLTRDTEQAASLAREAGVDAHIATAPPEEVPQWLSAADAGLALVRVSPSKDASFPTKVGEYLASGLAVLTTPVGDLERLADGAVLGLMSAKDGVGAAAAWLAKAAAAPDRAERARALAERTVGLEAGVEALVGVYERLGVHPEGTSGTKGPEASA